MNANNIAHYVVLIEQVLIVYQYNKIVINIFRWKIVKIQ